MGGGSRGRSYTRAIAWSIYSNVLKGSLQGLDPDLARALAEDRLSPGLREELAGYAREKALSYASQGLSEDEIRRRVASDVNTRFREIVEADRRWVELSKPFIVPPRDLRNPVQRLLPEEVGTWIEKRGRYIYVTYWFRFPYDVKPDDGPEYEPFTVVIDSRTGRVVEYQIRAHWNIVGIDPEDVVHIEGRPIIVFSAEGHTPIPLLRSILAATRVRIRRASNVGAPLAKIWVAVHRFARGRYVDTLPSIHVGPSRKEVREWRRNPLEEPWFAEVE